MNADLLANLASKWVRAGVMFGTEPSLKDPDMEQLLVDTVQHCSANSRFFTMAATWLSRFGESISADRLSILMEPLDDRSRSVMGLLLDCVRSISGFSCFDDIISRCEPAAEPQPLFDIERRNSTLQKLSEKHASAISLRWNLWMPEFEPQYTALRAPEWTFMVKSK